MKTVLTLVMTGCLAIALVVAQSPSAADLFQEALHVEEVKGDLQQAIAMYQTIVERFAADRSVAARAQFRIGVCYERLGKAEARRAYETVLREYVDQTDLTAQARARLAALGQPATGATASGMVVRRVWAGDAVHQLGAVSPDGRYFSYRDLATRDLAIRDLVRGETSRLTSRSAPSIGQIALPTFSPDSRQIVFTWNQFSEGFDDLQILRFDARPAGAVKGSEPRVLYSTRGEGANYTHIHPDEWSADGKYILASRFGPTDRTSQIVLVSVADGAVRVLKTLDWRSPLKMSLSPDGRYIAYDLPKENSPARDIFVLPTAEGREVPLVEHPADDRLLGWAPDGERVLFSSDRAGTVDAWVIPVVDGKPQGAPTRVKRDIGQVKPLGFTRNRSFYYGLDTESRDLYIATLDPETGKVLVPPARAVERIAANARPAWSADGQYLAYLSSQGPISRLSPVIVIRSLTTGEEREITPTLNRIELGETNLYVLRWSPDGKHLLVSGRDEKNRQGLFQIDAKTGDTTPIVYSNSGGSIISGCWSLDGKAIFYIARDTESNLPVGRIVRRDLETRQEKELYRLSVTPTALTRLFLSPDGRWLAFNQSQQPSRRLSIMIMPAGGGEARELPLPRPQDNREISELAGWTADSRQLLFMRRPAIGGPGGSGELWRISADGGEPQKLGLTITALSPDLSIHPDGRRVAFSTFLPKIEVWAMENFLSPLGVTR